MQRRVLRPTIAIALFAVAPLCASAQESLNLTTAADAILSADQILSGNTLELGNIDNSVAFAGDVATEASGAIGINTISGDFDLQENAAVLALIADTTASETNASTSLLQNLFGQALDSAHMRNAVSVDINTTGDVAGNVGLNAVSGAFNIQSNAIAIAEAPGSMLAQSFADLEQHAQQNRSTHHDVVNDMATNIILDGVSGNIGMNLASGVGNVQSNSITIARPF